MNLHCLQVNFDLAVPVEMYREMCLESVAAIRETGGLHWKVWALSDDGKQAAGLYLFNDRDSAVRYLEGPVIASLRKIGAVRNIQTTLLAVDEVMSQYTGLTSESQRVASKPGS